MLERICTRVIMLHDGIVAFDLQRDALEKRIEDGGFSDLTELYLSVAGKLESNETSK